MNELIQKVVQKTGITNEQATDAVNTVVGFLKEKLPAPMASQIDSLMQGGEGIAEKATGALGGLFGKK